MNVMLQSSSGGVDSCLDVLSLVFHSSFKQC